MIEAIRNGKRPDGTTIGPPMPIAFYRGMSDSDVRALVAYLHTVKPIHHVVEKSTYKNPLPPSYGPVVTHVPDVPRTDTVAYGQYLATALGHCMDCHTPLVQGHNDMTKVGAGGRQQPAPGGGIVISTNLTPANEHGIAHWTDQQIKTAITQGVRPDRPLVRLMAFDWYKHSSSADLEALVAYLRTLKPAAP
jgi:mono/diheme cytochrome c family protein